MFISDETKNKISADTIIDRRTPCGSPLEYHSKIKPIKTKVIHEEINFGAPYYVVGLYLNEKLDFKSDDGLQIKDKYVRAWEKHNGSRRKAKGMAWT